MNKKDLFIGFIIGIMVTTIGVFSMAMILTKFQFQLSEVLLQIKLEGIFGKVITLSALLNFGLFFLFLHFKKELMARGIVLATIISAITTIFI